MTQHLLSLYFCSPVQLLPRVKCLKLEHVINTLLYFRFKGRIICWKRQVCNEAQRACATLFLSVAMAMLSEFVIVAQEMATCNRKVRFLPHQFHAISIDHGDHHDLA